MIELIGDSLQVRFPEVYDAASCAVTFQRTLRVPDDGNEYPLPAGVGAFPLFSVDDFDTPAEWKSRGGVFLPVYQSEAMWLNFTARSSYPFAVKVAAGKINAVNGAAWTNALDRSQQDYLVIPAQPWIDGFYVAKGTIKQFVAAPLGEGLTVEEQVTGKAEFGGMQLLFMPMKAELYRQLIEIPTRIDQDISKHCYELDKAFRELEPMIARAEAHMAALRQRLRDAKTEFHAARDTPNWDRARKAVKQAEKSIEAAEKIRRLWEQAFVPYRGLMECSVPFGLRRGLDMGLGMGGRIRQEIAADPWGHEAWDTKHVSRCYVHMLNSVQFQKVTGRVPPTQPISPADYEEAGIPWFDYYVKGDVLGGSDVLAGVKSINDVLLGRGKELAHNTPVSIAKSIDLSGL